MEHDDYRIGLLLERRPARTSYDVALRSFVSPREALVTKSSTSEYCLNTASVPLELYHRHISAVLIRFLAEFGIITAHWASTPRGKRGLSVRSPSGGWIRIRPGKMTVRTVVSFRPERFEKAAISAQRSLPVEKFSLNFDAVKLR